MWLAATLITYTAESVHRKIRSLPTFRLQLAGTYCVDLPPLCVQRRVNEIRSLTSNTFLIRIQVGEDDYHQLKHDQCLRVDFKSFPTKFIELLESCRTTSSGGGAVDAEAGDGGGALDEGGRSTRGEALPLGGSGEPSFLARLETVVPGGFSVFSVVETNPFKELTHLSLKFRAGNDAAIKTYLAARLRQVS